MRAIQAASRFYRQNDLSPLGTDRPNLNWMARICGP